MYRLTTGIALVAAASFCGVAVAQTLPIQRYPFKSGPVTITACSVGQSGNLVANNSLDIKFFQNERDRNLKSVTFRVHYAGKTATLTNNGTFSYQAPIEVKSDQLDGSPYAGPHPQACRVFTATFADGTIVTPAHERMRRDEPAMAPGQEPGAPEASAAPEAAPEATTEPMESPAPQSSPTS